MAALTVLQIGLPPCTCAGLVMSLPLCSSMVQGVCAFVRIRHIEHNERCAASQRSMSFCCTWQPELYASI